jgi:predicted O-methyltransferase YrrM
MRVSAELNQFRQDFIERFRRIGMNTAPGDAQFLRVLIESSKAKNGLEIGTANGYGAIVMGLAFEQNKGHLTTVEIDAGMAATARANIKKVKLQEAVTVLKGAALKVIPKLVGSFDFIFLDAWKGEYLAHLRAIEPKLKRRALIVADNVIRFADEMRDFLDAVRVDPRYHSVVVRASEDKHDGMIVVSKA